MILRTEDDLDTSLEPLSRDKKCTLCCMGKCLNSTLSVRDRHQVNHGTYVHAHHNRATHNRSSTANCRMLRALSCAQLNTYMPYTIDTAVDRLWPSLRGTVAQNLTHKMQVRLWYLIPDYAPAAPQTCKIRQRGDLAGDCRRPKKKTDLETVYW